MAGTKKKVVAKPAEKKVKELAELLSSFHSQAAQFDPWLDGLNEPKGLAVAGKRGGDRRSARKKHKDGAAAKKAFDAAVKAKRAEGFR